MSSEPGTASRTEAPAPARWTVIGDAADGLVAIVDIAADGSRAAPARIPREMLAQFVSERERAGTPRWVWSDTPHWLPALLDAGVRVMRCHDLRLCHAILEGSARVRDTTALRAASEWQRPSVDMVPRAQSGGETLFEWDTAGSVRTVPADIDAALAEFTRQRDALSTSDPRDAARVQLLLAAESAGALIACEMRAAGLPWDVAEHDRILREALGPRPVTGAKPAAMAELTAVIADALGDPHLSIDSPPKLLRSLRAAGIEVQSTSKWELADHEHPAIAPLLQYKQLARLLTANGWSWIDEWVRDGRYRPVYVPGGVVTGRWASSGGGALQIPRRLRPVIHADPGWTLVSADVAQLEPRVLAAMASDGAMAAAGQGRDLYAGIVESGVVSTRQEAKIAVLGAMYGATTGDSGRLVPRLRRGFPRAMGLVDAAADTGERGGVVSTWLGRSSPPPADDWAEAQALAQSGDASADHAARARRAAREFGRFTRNFVVQGTAAEWALAWLADLRGQLAYMPAADGVAAHASGPVFATQPHLAFFLHDEVIVHTPAAHAEAVAEAVRGSAAAAGRLLFGDTAVDFPLDVRISERAEKG